MAKNLQTDSGGQFAKMTVGFKFARFIWVLALCGIGLQASAADPSWTYHLNEEFEKGYFYSIAVRAGDMLYIGGVTAVDADGNELYPTDVAKQMKVIYERIEKILNAHDATFRNVVSETIYYGTGTQDYISALGVRAEYYSGEGIEGPTASGVKISDFTSDNILVEVKAIAYLGK